MSIFSCLSCKVVFTDSILQREHMKTEWHRYNLKRKVVGLPCIDLQTFATKLEVETVEEEIYECTKCSKVYGSKGMLETHNKSKKHIDFVPHTSDSISGSVSGDGSSISGSGVSVDMKESYKVRIGRAKTENEINEILQEKLNNATRLTVNDCLFCVYHGDSIEENIQHMAQSHSFFVPDLEYLIDLPALIQFLSDKITVTNMCLFCNGRGKMMFSVEAVRDHMIDKGHCKTDEDEELDDFYNFDDGAEVLSDDEGFEDDEVEFGESEMVLKSGVRLGHRAFKRYWNQNLRHVAILPGSMADPEMQKRMSIDYKRLGYSAQVQSRFSPLEMVRRQELKVKTRATKLEMRTRQELTARVGVKHNMLQHHYREQNPF